eukprot:GHVU01165272.1.p1 GENE.GHVU01165272.1~~GHVU01165272.1.p1  ORF type:complete len:582 (-),score=93.32 GHVU01165272.1:79-1752(-)
MSAAATGGLTSGGVVTSSSQQQTTTGGGGGGGGALLGKATPFAQTAPPLQGPILAAVMDESCRCRSNPGVPLVVYLSPNTNATALSRSVSDYLLSHVLPSFGREALRKLGSHHVAWLLAVFELERRRALSVGSFNGALVYMCSPGDAAEGDRLLLSAALQGLVDGIFTYFCGSMARLSHAPSFDYRGRMLASAEGVLLYCLHPNAPVRAQAQRVCSSLSRVCPKLPTTPSFLEVLLGSVDLSDRAAVYVGSDAFAATLRAIAKSWVMAASAASPKAMEMALGSYLFAKRDPSLAASRFFASNSNGSFRSHHHQQYNAGREPWMAAGSRQWRRRHSSPGTAAFRSASANPSSRHQHGVVVGSSGRGGAPPRPSGSRAEEEEEDFNSGAATAGNGSSADPMMSGPVSQPIDDSSSSHTLSGLHLRGLGGFGASSAGPQPLSATLSRGAILALETWNVMITAFAKLREESGTGGVRASALAFMRSHGCATASAVNVAPTTHSSSAGGGGTGSATATGGGVGGATGGATYGRDAVASSVDRTAQVLHRLRWQQDLLGQVRA